MVTLKLLTIGDSGVGKTCLLLKYSSGQFSPMFITTIGIDYKLKTIRINQRLFPIQLTMLMFLVYILMISGISSIFLKLLTEPLFKVTLRR